MKRSDPATLAKTVAENRSKARRARLFNQCLFLGGCGIWGISNTILYRLFSHLIETNPLAGIAWMIFFGGSWLLTFFLISTSFKEVPDISEP